MKWSYRLGQVAGIDLRIHVTFLILLGVLALGDLLTTGSVVAAFVGMAFVIAVFASVTLHELGHALMARVFGIGTHDITLSPIGGVARLSRNPSRPKEELLIALAGPAVNIAIASVLALFAVLVGANVGGGSLLAGDFVARLLWTNVVLAAFNLLPAFPMDGGRVLRAFLAMRMHKLEATRLAAKIGRGMAVIFGIVGLFTNPMLVLIAGFVWMMAGQEVRQAEAEASWRAPSLIRNPFGGSGPFRGPGQPPPEPQGPYVYQASPKIRVFHAGGTPTPRRAPVIIRID